MLRHYDGEILTKSAKANWLFVTELTNARRWLDWRDNREYARESKMEKKNIFICNFDC